MAQIGIKVRAFCLLFLSLVFPKSFLAHYSFSSGEATVGKAIWKCVPRIFFTLDFSAYCRGVLLAVFFFSKINLKDAFVLSMAT